MCGIVGLFGSGNVAGEIYDGLIAIQHRGQDAAGISTFDSQFHLHKGEGLVQEIFTPQVMAGLTGSIGIGHVRYPTVGCGGVADAQPFLIPAPFGVAMVHNGNLTNYHELKRELVSNDFCHIDSNCDVEALLHVFGLELLKRGQRLLVPDDVFAAVKGVFARAKGAYSVVGMIAGQGLFAFRDPLGIKPIIMGERDLGNGQKAYCVTSESVALDLLDYHNTRCLEPGEVVFIDNQRRVHTAKVAQETHHPCVFEWVYFARPDSFLDKVSVYKSRLRMGEELAEIWKKTGRHADVVIPVPESSRPAAMAMAKALGLPYREGLVKNRYIGRTFIMPGQEARKRSIRYKLNPIQLEFEGKDVLLVDDSIVRGNTAKALVRLARSVGARTVHLASYSPPVKYPCLYGIDMSTSNEFIARDKTPEEIAKFIGADSVVYQSMEGMLESVRQGNPDLKDFCNACFSGKYPTNDITPEILAAWEKDRAHSAADQPFVAKSLAE